MAQFLHYHDLTDIVLVGTSSGGMVMARLAELMPERIERLVFADALMLMDGEKIRDIVTRPAAINTELALGPSPEDAETRLLAGLEPGLRSWAAERFTLHPTAVFHQSGQTRAVLGHAMAGIGLILQRSTQSGRSHICDVARKRWAPSGMSSIPGIIRC